MPDLLITGARVVTRQAVLDSDVAIRGSKIRLVGGPPRRNGSGRVPCLRLSERSGDPDAVQSGRKHATFPGPAQIIDARGLVLLPGFIDIHTHGYGGFDFTLGVYNAASDSFDGSRDRSLEALDAYVRQMPRTGLTTSYLATIAAPVPALRERLALLKEFLRRPPLGTRVIGAFLEGSFISEKMRGAMSAELVQRPDVAVFDAIDASGMIRLALVAPDEAGLRLTLIRHVARRGVIVGAGHTNCTADELDAARRAGLRYVVHFLNGPTGHSYKPFHGGGAVEGALADDRLYAELIADGYHIDPRYVRDVLARKGFDRVIAVSDSMFAAGARGLKSFQMFGVFGKVGPDGKYLQVASDPLTLYGSCLDMSTAASNLLSWLTRPMPGVWTRRHEALTSDEALVAVGRMAATNAARLTGLDRRLRIGEIATGRTADLVLARLAGRPGAYRLQVQRTWLAGQEVFCRR